MRVLAVAAALTLAVAAPAAGAPSLGSSGCPLFPADNVLEADVTLRAVQLPGRARTCPQWAPAPASAPTRLRPRTHRVRPQLLTAILGLVAATLAARVVLRTRRLQDQHRPPQRARRPRRGRRAPPDPDPTPTRRR